MSNVTVAVVGAGTMGSGIATVTARAGMTTLLCDRDHASVERGLKTVKDFLERGAARGKLSETDAADASARVSGVIELGALGGADVAIEAIHEDLPAKQQLLADLDEILKPEALVHTNTSTLSVTSIAAGSRRPGRVVGTHYCNPAALMKLVEVVRGQVCDERAFERTVAFVRNLGKVPVVTKDLPGFIVNRFLIPWENSVIRALEDGMGTVESIDRAVKAGLGHPMGPFELLDIVGMDIHKEVSLRLYEQIHEPRFAPPPLVDRMIAAGTLGRKTSRGFYSYDNDRLFGS